MGSIFVPIMMFGWIVASIGFFATMQPRRAVITAFVGAWLFLPIAGYKITEGIPVYDKMLAATVGVLVGAMIYDSAGLLSFRPAWWDLPMVVWCVCPLASSMTNGLGEWDGLSAAFAQTLPWGVPYVIGRIYFTNSMALRELAIGVFIGGMIYVPFCLWESRMSPSLHRIVYGYLAHGVAQVFSYRWGGWRPMVFMQHGLAVGMWMTMASLLGVWLWYSRAIPRVWRGIPTSWFVLTIVLTAILCRSTGALALLAAGMGVLALSSLLHTRMAVWLLLAVAPTAMLTRMAGLWDGRSLVDLTNAYVGSERAQSLDFRLKNEDQLIAKALQQPAFGWGRWGRARVYNEFGQDLTITDGLWIITLGNCGLVGLAAWVLAMLLPVGMLFSRHPPNQWRMPDYSAGIAGGVLILLYAIDCIPNGMVNPIIMLLLGGISTQLVYQVRTARGGPFPQRVVRPRRLAGSAAAQRLVDVENHA